MCFNDIVVILDGNLRRYHNHVQTIAVDNGGKFCSHEQDAEKLKTDMYFANPYSSWGRGLNENFNCLLRQYIRKGTDLRTVINEPGADTQRALNLRPRKCLGYRRPIFIFNELRRAA
ncbi:IS30 family transposase [Paraglaciecola chathamensis]|jgi:IS30 family transposase|uniref:IS30 family transposase n=1 Tax=Paraglaciecola chathamensis TaxID=368405 RepID=A0ABS0W878_9ALTE|nr:IS30 family transposase [Paraglaciecola chathamensis]